MMFSALARLLQLSTANILLSDPASAQVRSETGFNNSCLARDSRLNRAGPREFDCAQWVIESTDKIWNMYRGGWCPTARACECVTRCTMGGIDNTDAAAHTHLV